ncbi:hypothetical protein PVAG01_04690 [Phlyctema vagabunda]|uniref:Uncharacterized protein n=1 Tax=Phlyctema vagabunda TaxID=108571 RepID=A0ABR4PI00_9HELO
MLKAFSTSRSSSNMAKYSCVLLISNHCLPESLEQYLMRSVR